MKKEKQIYEKPVMDITYFKEDIITTSGGGGINDEDHMGDWAPDTDPDLRF